MNTTNIKIRGLTPLIMHSGRLADPLDPATQTLARLTSKRQKTIDDHKAIAKAEWYGGIYVDDKQRPCLPGEVIEACLVEGAKKFKLGKVAKGGIICADNAVIDHGGPKTIDALWDHGGYMSRAGVRVQKARVIRTRPMFPQWSVSFDIMWDPRLVKDEDQLMEIAMSAGQCGICEWRPKYGRFEVLS